MLPISAQDGTHSELRVNPHELSFHDSEQAKAEDPKKHQYLTNSGIEVTFDPKALSPEAKKVKEAQLAVLIQNARRGMREGTSSESMGYGESSESMGHGESSELVNAWSAKKEGNTISYRVAAFQSKNRANNLSAAKDYIKNTLKAVQGEKCYIFDGRFLDAFSDMSKFEDHKAIFEQAVNELNNDGYQIEILTYLADTPVGKYSSPLKKSPTSPNTINLEQIVDEAPNLDYTKRGIYKTYARRVTELLKKNMLTHAEGVLVDALLSILSEHISSIKNVSACKSNKDRSSVEFIMMLALRAVILHREEECKKKVANSQSQSSNLANFLNDIVKRNKINRYAMTFEEIDLFVENFDTLFLYKPSAVHLGITTNVNTNSAHDVLSDFINDYPKLSEFYFHKALGS